MAKLFAATDKYRATMAMLWKVAVAGVVAFIVHELAGKDTQFKAVIEAALKMDLSKGALMALNAITGGGWYYTHRLKKKEVGNLSKHNKELESTIDPNRTSTRLSDSGTPPRKRKDS